MAKKKLTPYQQARRQYVQARVAQRGLEGTPEERANIRQRFDVLAQTKEGRTKIAQRALPNAPQEDRKSFKRMLATELPARNMGGGGGGGGGGGETGGGKPKYAKTDAQAITKAWQGAVQSGTYKVPTPTYKKKDVTTQTSTTTPKTTVASAWANRRNNIIGKGINYPGRNIVEAITNPFGSKGAITDFSPKGITKAAGMELAEAAVAVPAARVAAGGLAAGKAGLKYGIGVLAKFLPKGPDRSINKFGGVGKTSYGPTKDNLSPLALGPGKTPSVPKSLDPFAKTVKTKSGGVGSKPYGPPAPARIPTPKRMPKENLVVGGEKVKVADTVAERGATSNPAIRRVLVDKQGSAKTGAAKTGAAKTSSKKTGEESLQAGIPTNVTAKFKYATEADKPFLQTLNAAQQEIAKQGPKMRQYTLWLNSPNTQATLRRLRTGK